MLAGRERPWAARETLQAGVAVLKPGTWRLHSSLYSLNSGSSVGGTARKGPKRAQPLAPLCKFPGMAGAAAAWEGPPVILDGTAGYRRGRAHALARPWIKGTALAKPWINAGLIAHMQLQPYCAVLDLQPVVARLPW